MSKRIIISVTSDIYTDQRVLKTANSCIKSGYDVLLVGKHLKTSVKPEIICSIKKFRLLFNHSALFYAEYNIRLFFLLLFSKYDILLSNDTDTLPANFIVSKIRRKKLIFDAHELFPEVPELENRKFVKKIWTIIEDSIFPHLKNAYTVCNSIADYYNKKYNMNMKVIRNVPHFSDRAIQKKTISKHDKKIILYQGALNVGRGLEWILYAMPLIDNAKFVIIGDGDITEKLKKLTFELNITDRVEFMGRMEGKKIREITHQADLGFCLLENKGLSYYYSLPNRIFDYLNAGVEVLASDFPEIRNIVEKRKTGKIIDHYEPEYLADVIKDMLQNPLSTDHFVTLSKEFCWENEEKILLSIIQNAK